MSTSNPDPEPSTGNETWPNLLSGQWMSPTGKWAEIEQERQVPATETEHLIGQTVLHMLEHGEAAVTNFKLPSGRCIAIYRHNPSDAILHIKEISDACDL